jgi:hypothetical protein
LKRKAVREIFRPKKNEGSEKFRTSREEEFGHSHRSPSVVRIAKCRKLRWSGMYLEGERKGM